MIRLDSVPSRVLAQPRRTTLFLWGVLAALNLGAGIVLATHPDRASDLETMQRWTKEWLVDGSNIYALDWEACPYPPHAIVALSLLGVAPSRWVVPVWTIVNLGLAALAPYLALRAVRPMLAPPAMALPILLFLCWGGVRTLLQFSLLALTLGLLAQMLADRRPNWSGLCLGLALMKPQIAVPFVLWALFTRRLRVVCLATAVAALGLVAFCLRAEAEPVGLLLRYAGILRLLYTGDAIVVGLAQLRPLIAIASSNTAVVDTLAGVIALALLGAIAIIGFAEGKRRRILMYSAPPLAGLWSLLTFYHLTYGFIVLLPTMTLLLAANDVQTLAFRKRLFWFLQLTMIVDVPGAGRRVDHLFPVPRAIGTAMAHFDRALMLALFACVAMLAVRAIAADRSSTPISGGSGVVRRDGGERRE